MACNLHVDYIEYVDYEENVDKPIIKSYVAKENENMRRLQPKKFTEEQLTSFQKVITNQTVSTVPEKSTDPDNYPVFEVPVNQKVLIYVPNHTVIGADGREELRMDKPYLHSVREGQNRFSRVRCIKNLQDLGYSGSCPFCDAVDDGWELANAEIEEKCSTQGLDHKDKNNETVKAIKSASYNARAVKAPDLYFTFPIIVIETNPNNVKDIVKDEEGKVKYKAMWYTISEAAYKKKWVKALESMEEEPDNPGGQCFCLDYTYEPKNGGEPTKMDSARELVVLPKKMKGFEKYAELFDSITENWTPEKSAETVVDNIFAEEEDLQEEATKIMIPTRDKLELYRSLSVSGPAITDGSSGFNMTEANDSNSGIEEDFVGVPVETDLD
jgi:hypothetical protein